MKINKKIFMFGIPLLALVLVSAALVVSWGQVQVDMNVEEAITVTGETGCVLDTVAGGDYELCLINIKNNLGEVITIQGTLSVQKFDETAGEYVNLENHEGVLIAITEDVSYYFNPNHGYCSEHDLYDGGCGGYYENQPLLEWIGQYGHGIDWLVTQDDVGEYDTSVVTEASDVMTFAFAGVPNINGEYTVPAEFSADYDATWALYVDSSVALEEGNYRVTFEIAPITQ